MGMVQDVRIAKRTGFCYGVREAVDRAKEAADAGKVTRTLGQVVHNEGVVASLNARGVASIASLEEAEPGSTVVIRAHGVTPAVREAATGKGLEVIDGTCSWVIAEQKQLQQLVADDYTIVLLGTPNHPEVIGLLGFAPDAIVVDDEEDWDRIPRRKRMALITQSTQPPWKFERLAARMVNLAHELMIVNTVCPVTIRRQEDTVDTAGEVDFMVVVGGRSSANTKELTRLCEIVGTPAIQVEHARDLVDPAVFDDPPGRRHRRDVDADRGPGARGHADPRAGGDARGAGPRRRARPPGPLRRRHPGRSHQLAAGDAPAAAEPAPAAR